MASLRLIRYFSLSTMTCYLLWIVQAFFDESTLWPRSRLFIRSAGDEGAVSFAAGGHPTSFVERSSLERRFPPMHSAGTPDLSHYEGLPIWKLQREADKLRSWYAHLGEMITQVQHGQRIPHLLEKDPSGSKEQAGWRPARDPVRQLRELTAAKEKVRLTLMALESRLTATHSPPDAVRKVIRSRHTPRS